MIEIFNRKKRNKTKSPRSPKKISYNKKCNRYLCCVTIDNNLVYDHTKTKLHYDSNKSNIDNNLYKECESNSRKDEITPCFEYGMNMNHDLYSENSSSKSSSLYDDYPVLNLFKDEDELYDTINHIESPQSIDNDLVRITDESPISVPVEMLSTTTMLPRFHNNYVFESNSEAILSPKSKRLHAIGIDIYNTDFKKLPLHPPSKLHNNEKQYKTSVSKSKSLSIITLKKNLSNSERFETSKDLVKENIWITFKYNDKYKINSITLWMLVLFITILLIISSNLLPTNSYKSSDDIKNPNIYINEDRIINKTTHHSSEIMIINQNYKSKYIPFLILNNIKHHIILQLNPSTIPDINNNQFNHSELLKTYQKQSILKLVITNPIKKIYDNIKNKYQNIMNKYHLIQIIIVPIIKQLKNNIYKYLKHISNKWNAFKLNVRSIDILVIAEYILYINKKIDEAFLKAWYPLY